MNPGTIAEATKTVCKTPSINSSSGFIKLSLTGYMALGCAALVGLVSLYAYVQTSRLEACKSKYEAFVSETERLGKEAEIKVKQEIERQKKVTKDVSSDYETRLNLLRDTYARLRDQRSGSGSMPPVPNAPRSIDEIPADSIPLAGICAETTQQLNSLQEWVLKQKR